MFTGCATAGYAIYAIAPSWPYVFLGLAAVMAWKAGAFPTTFAVIGDSLPRDRRAMAFAVQSTLIRVPRVLGAPLGGLAIVTFGMAAGIRLAFTITIVIAVAVMVVQYFGFRDVRAPQAADTRRSPRLVFAAMPAHLKQLLVADALVRIGEGIAASFIVLFVLQVRHLSAADYGMLYAVQQAISIAFYLPGGKLADVMGRTWMVVLTFLFFAAFPLAVRYAASYPYLVGAFIVGGLKEIGEPARKSLIVDLAPDETRASTVGVYLRDQELPGRPGRRARRPPVAAGSAITTRRRGRGELDWRGGVRGVAASGRHPGRYRGRLKPASTAVGLTGSFLPGP